MSVKETMLANKEYLIKSYNEGKSTCQLGKEFNVSNASVFIFLRDNGVTMRKQKTTVADNKEQILKLYEQGNSCYKIAKILGIAENSVNRCLTKSGIDVSSGHKCREDPLTNHKEEIIDLYQNGVGSFLLGKLYECYDASIIQRLKAWGVERRPIRKHEINHDFFEKIDSEAKAYILGFMMADGCNHANKDYVTLAITDADILEDIRLALGYGGHLYESEAGLGRRLKIYILNMYSRKMCGDLTRLGCVQNKTYCANFPNEEQVPKELVRHFLRGLMDGDGTITHSVGKLDWRSNIVGTKAICEGMKSFLRENLNINSSLFVKITNPETGYQTWCCAISGRAALKVYLDWLYKDATIYLNRKHAKYQEFLSDYVAL